MTTRNKLLFLLRFFLAMVVSFVSAKFIFLLYNGWPGWNEALHIVRHGLALDLSVSAYATAPLWIALLVSVIRPQYAPRWARRLYRLYAYLMAIVVLLFVIIDTVLYSKWGFKLDAVVLSYLDNPEAIAGSLDPLMLLLGVGLFSLLVWAYASALTLVYPAEPSERAPHRYARPALGSALLLIGGALFLCIRGGIGRSTANVGMVYYSTVQYYNHAAVNPAFSFLYSLMKSKDFSEQGLYFEPQEAARLYGQLAINSRSEIAPADSLLRTKRPNILLILMESCGGRVVGCTEGNPVATPNIDRLAREGVFFSRCYANSFRTDRGTICTFSGYPAFPDASVMKMPAKSRVLPSIAGSLRRAGYATQFLYGGDKNFTNMNSYFLATGYESVLGDVDFPAEHRKTSPWGITDHIMFDLLSQKIAAAPKGRPWFKTLLTLASHEPWQVPHNALPDPMLNAFHYLDKSLGDFIGRLRQSPEWDNTLVIILPDHGTGWPADINEYDTRKYHIPLIWTGGAIRGARTVDALCNQTDLPATLLGQLGLPHDDFPFSRDVLSQTYTYPWAIHTWPEGCTFIDSTGVTIYEIATHNAAKSTPDPTGVRLNRAKAFMQTAYRHLDALK
ncbi:MAG: LTA synthase family protein [Bacteroidaceae bacterium]|nr:LTA synthase family protein [Bacteroidaceae bacterium]